jgi:hypothetical protein
MFPPIAIQVQRNSVLFLAGGQANLCFAILRSWPGAWHRPADMRELRPEERFSDRVENYIRFRPGYPGETKVHLGR